MFKKQQKQPFISGDFNIITFANSHKNIWANMQALTALNEYSYANCKKQTILSGIKTASDLASYSSRIGFVGNKIYEQFNYVDIGLAKQKLTHLIEASFGASVAPIIWNLTDANPIERAAAQAICMSDSNHIIMDIWQQQVSMIRWKDGKTETENIFVPKLEPQLWFDLHNIKATKAPAQIVKGLNIDNLNQSNPNTITQVYHADLFGYPIIISIDKCRRIVIALVVGEDILRGNLPVLSTQVRIMASMSDKFFLYNPDASNITKPALGGDIATVWGGSIVEQLLSKDNIFQPIAP